MFNGENGREAGGEIPPEVFEYLKSRGRRWRIERGTEVVGLWILDVPDDKVRGTRKKVMDILWAAKAPENIQICFE